MSEDRRETVEALPHAYLLHKLAMVMPLFEEARDALCAISTVAAKLHHVDLTLGQRMDIAGTFSLDDWKREFPERAALEGQQSPEPVAWIRPSDLAAFATQETTAVVASVKFGTPEEVSVPLYASPQSSKHPDEYPRARPVCRLCGTDKWIAYGISGDEVPTTPAAALPEPSRPAAAVESNHEGGLASAPISTRRYGDKTHDRDHQEGDQRAGGKERESDGAARGNAVCSSGSESGARSGDAAQHEVEERGGVVRPRAILNTRKPE